MANPTLGGLIQEVRNRSGEPDPNGRWTNALLTNFANRASEQLGLVLEWPDSTLYFISQPGIQEYALDENVNLLRVYIGGPPGQPVVPTEIDMLQGTQIGLYDQTQTSPPYTAQWMTQPPEAYPVASSTGYPVALTVPWARNRRPSFYVRGAGAVLGLLPAPSIGYVVQCDFIAQPKVLENLDDSSDFPDKAVDALAFKMMYYMAQADRNPEQMAVNEKMYGGDDGTGGAVGKLLSWKRDVPKHKSRSPLFVTARTRWQGPARWGSGRGRVGR